ncbi:hypothetical protein ACFE04_008841 [Oxalis oulophora]
MTIISLFRKSVIGMNKLLIRYTLIPCRRIGSDDHSRKQMEERAAKVYRDRTSIVYGTLSFTWTQTYQRCIKLASALALLGISPADVVATLSPNVPAMYELHFGVPMAGAVLCTLNPRHDSNMLSAILKHSGAKVIFVDYELVEVAREALNILSDHSCVRLPTLVVIPNSAAASSGSYSYEYENLLEAGESEFEIRRPSSEWDPISVNYTSGTTSRPKGVIYSHRGAYLNSLATVLFHEMGSMPVYLWTVPMFHCNGLCLIWGGAAQGATNICSRKVIPKDIFDSIVTHNVTHMSGAPTVLNMIINSAASDRKPLPCKVRISTGGSPPSPHILHKMEELGFIVTHLYGLTETYGPGAYCAWKPEWDSLPQEEKSKVKSRQGVPHVCVQDVDVKSPTTMESVQADGKNIGEVMFRGNTVMNGYLNDLEETKKAFKGGWFHTGDLAVKHPDGYIEVKDRSKDVIISGGENISSVEVEMILYNHPAVLEAAVVARPDDHWGQTPCAFVMLKEGYGEVSDQEIIQFCRDRLPKYMAPRTVIISIDLPRTITGKIQKFILRDKANALGSLH